MCYFTFATFTFTDKCSEGESCDVSNYVINDVSKLNHKFFNIVNSCITSTDVHNKFDMLI